MPDPPMAAVAVARVAEEDAVVDVGPGAAVAAGGCPPDILQRGKSSRECRNWYMKQLRRKRRAAAGRGDAVAVPALLKVRLKHNEYEKQYQRKRRDAARRGDASALAALQNYRLKHNEHEKQRQRKRRDAARRGDASALTALQKHNENKRRKRKGPGSARYMLGGAAVVDGDVGGSLQGGAAQALPRIV